MSLIYPLDFTFDTRSAATGKKLPCCGPYDRGICENMTVVFVAQWNRVRQAREYRAYCYEHAFAFHYIYGNPHATTEKP